MNHLIKISTPVSHACSAIIITVLGLIMLTTAMPSAQASNYSECVAAQERYNKNLRAVENARDADDHYRNCNLIKPSIGYANCEAFIQSGNATPQQIAWARQVSGQLAAVYGKCRAQ